MNSLLSDNLWPTIKKLSKKSKRTKVAVAYFGTNAAEQIRLKKGDVLVTALSPSTCKAGQVNPFELEKLYKKGVLLYALQNLHAKVFLFDKQVIIGSSNVSSFSENNLVEAAVLTSDANVRKDAEKFISEYTVEPVEQDFLEVCKKNYNPPKIHGVRTQQQTNFKGELSRLWVISTKPVEFTEQDEKAAEKERPKFEKKLTNKHLFEVVDIKWGLKGRFIKEVEEGDIIIEIEENRGRASALQPKRALGVTRDNKSGIAYLRVEERKKVVRKPWSGLERKLRANGVAGVTKNSIRQIKNEETKKLLLDYFS